MAVGERIMKDLIKRLNEASVAYYGGQPEIMSNQEWDELYSRLVKLEKKYGQLPDSPTNKVGADWNEAYGQKVEHEFPALSLPKTKDVRVLETWMGDKPGWLSWKLDGLTLVLTYDRGELTSIVTRGNGYSGTDVTYMKGCIKGIPTRISYHLHLVVRGEAVISYRDFDRINEENADGIGAYANPRNLAAGTFNLGPDNLMEVKRRSVQFIAFSLVDAESFEYACDSWGLRMALLERLGFKTVDRIWLDGPNEVESAVKELSDRVAHYDIPVDGLVLCYDDLKYVEEGGVTRHHVVRGGIAFKWADESKITTLRRVEWSCGINSITPVAVFDPIDIDGAVIRRASLVNVSEVRRLGIGDPGKTEIEVVRSNMIIPKVIRVISRRGGDIDIPVTCPACGRPTVVYVSPAGVQILKCTNTECPAKELKKYARFVGKTGLDIEGLGEETLKELISLGLIHEVTDIFRLADHIGETRDVPNIKNILKAIEDCELREIRAENLITALSIPNVGPDTAHRLVQHYGWPGLFNAFHSIVDFTEVDGIGQETAWNLHQFRMEHMDLLWELKDILYIKEVDPIKEGTCLGLRIAITGSLSMSRDALKKYIEDEGGVVTSTVSQNTDILINNDRNSKSGKNKRAAEFGVQVLSEEAFWELYLDHLFD